MQAYGGDVRVGGAWLRRLRESQGLTQRELEQRTGGRVSYANISQLEIGATLRPSAWMLAELGKVLGFDPNTAAERFGWWTGDSGRRTGEPEEITYLKNVLSRLSPGQRYSLLQSIEALAAVAERQIER